VSLSKNIGNQKVSFSIKPLLYFAPSYFKEVIPQSPLIIKGEKGDFKNSNGGRGQYNKQYDPVCGIS